jgi:glycosyltransferase involved in cell wall biosynthesis
MKTAVSVIIPTYNGAHKILNTHRALEHQSVKDFEVIVAIDGSNDGTQELLEGKTFTFNNFKCISQSNKGRAGIRNFGAKAASGDLLIFYDDDMRPEQDSISKHVEFHSNYKDSIYGGNQLEDLKVLKTDIQRYKAYLSRKWTAKYCDGLNELSDNDLFLTAANMSVPKKLFLELGGFDERLTDAEDFEFAVRAFSKGVPVYFDKTNIAWHDDFISCKSYICRQRQYNLANTTLQAILPPTFLRSASCVTGLPLHKRVIYHFFSLKCWVILADKGWLAWLPKKLRYKIYDIIITGLGKYYPQRSLD